MRIEAVGYDHPDARRLIQEVQQEYVVRYGTADVSSVQVQDFQPPNGLFLVGYVDGVAVASGSWRDPGPSDWLRAGDAELKRMYVDPGFRGRGLARGVLGELERSASLAGFKRCVLETGTEQPEAIGLYRSCGYEPIAKFGAYREDPLSRCFGKEI